MLIFIGIAENRLEIYKATGVDNVGTKENNFCNGSVAQCPAIFLLH